MENFISKIKNNISESFYIKGGFFVDFFDWQDIENITNNYVYSNYIDLVDKQNRKVNPDRHNIPWVGPTKDVNQIAEMVNQGCSFIITAMSKYNHGCNYICSMLDKELSAESDIHVYGGLHEDSKSFPIHSDQPHNLIIQVQGTCEWTVFKDTSWKPENLHSDEGLTEDFKIIAEEGDVIYIPSLVLHRCIPNSQRLSFSIPFTVNNNRPLRRWNTLNE